MFAIDTAPTPMFASATPGSQASFNQFIVTVIGP
jgi:hypothetical protein